MPSNASGEDMILQQSIIVKAGAGAGKTTSLIQRFIDFSKGFKAQHARWPRIVLTTFTKKATHEIKERLFQKALADNDIELFEYINSSSMVQITTIHGLLSSFLRESGLEMGLRPQVTIGDERLLDREKRQTLRQIFLEKPEWSEVLEVWKFSELMRILEEWSSELTKNGELSPWPAEEIFKDLKLHLLEKSQEVKAAIKTILNITDNPDWISYGDTFPKIDGSTSFEELLDRLKTWVDFSEKPRYSKKANFDKSLSDDLMDKIKELDRVLQLKILDPQFYEQILALQNVFDPLAQEFAKRYFTLRLEKGLLSYNDLELLSLKMVREYPELVQHFADYWDYWLIDEYQDTSPLQVDLLNAFIGQKPHYVVGDPQQSIYLFRGARSEVFQNKIQEFKEKNFSVVSQMKNYRSRKEVLLFINRYFSYFGNAFGSMEVGSTQTNSAPAVDVIPLKEDQEESLRARDYIISLLESGTKPEEICILGATHQLLASLREKLEEFGIDFQLHAHGQYYAQDEVVDGLTILKFLSNPHDNKNFVGLLRSPWFRVSEIGIESYCRVGSYWINAVKEPSEGKEVIAKLQKYLLLTKEIGISEVFKKMLFENGLFQSALTIDPTGQREGNLWKLVLDLVAAEKGSGFSVTDYLRRIDENQAWKKSETENEAAPFIEPRKIQLMTIHASKGLQFENVILLGYGKEKRKSDHEQLAFKEKYYSISTRDEEDNKPVHSWLSIRNRQEINQREEEESLRVLYVALTRAKSKIAFFESFKPSSSSWQASFPGSWAGINLGHAPSEEMSLVQTLDSLPVVSEWKPKISLTEKAKLVKPFRELSDVKTVLAKSVTEQLNTGKAGLNWSIESFRKIQKGVDFHRLVEFIKYEADSQKPPKDPEFLKALEFVKTTTEIPLMDLIKNGFVEWGFTIKREGQIIRGQIDLWAYYDNTLWVVDYKTGKSGAATVVAFEQVNQYAKAIKQIHDQYKNTPVKLVIVYPFEQKILVR